MANYNISHSFFEDDEKNIIFFYSGRDTVLGLSHPDYITKNNDHFKYARVAFLKPSDLGNSSTIVYLEEKLSIDAFTPEENKMNIAKSADIVIGALAKNGRVLKNTVYCTVHNDYAHDANRQIKVYITEDSYVDSDGNKKYGLGIWFDIEEDSYLLTTVVKSYSANACPIDTEHFSSGYEAEYLNTTELHTDINITNSLDIITANQIIVAAMYNDNNNARLTALEEKTQYMPFGFVQNTVVYDNIYKPHDANTDEIITPTSIRGVDTDRIIKLDPANRAFTVLQEGAYQLQIKNGLYLTTGETDVSLSLYNESAQLADSKMNIHLFTRNNKPVKMGYSSNSVMLHLYPGDKIYLKANWDNIDNLTVDNETVVSVTAMMYYPETAKK